jgi:hypothetical protein
MLIYSMSFSVDGFIADREGAFGWSGIERLHHGPDTAACDTSGDEPSSIAEAWTPIV